MRLYSKRESITLISGDILVLALSLVLSLVARYGPDFTSDVLKEHAVPFAILFAVWIFVFFIFGLYEKHTIVFLNRLPFSIVNAQVVNAFFAILFFYFVPYFGIAPKTNLFLFLLVSSVLIMVWRIKGYMFLSPKEKHKGILIGGGAELKELEREVNHNPIYGIEWVSVISDDTVGAIDFQKEVVERVYSENISIVAVDLSNEKVGPILPRLYNLIFSKIKFMDMHKVYEDIFNRIPLSLVKYSWFMENISASPKVVYDATKRFLDVVVAGAIFILSLPFYVLVYVLIKLDDGGPIFIRQERVGKDNKPIRIIKFRSMERDDAGEYGKTGPNKVTKVGAFLRKSRIDELPQLWNVVRGDLSLIGPRPELPALVKTYQEVLPYYNIRHLIKPGLSGWAQLYHDNHPHHSTDVSETKVKLSYDLFYLKNRSFIIDLKIILKTIKILLTFKGR